MQKSSGKLNGSNWHPVYNQDVPGTIRGCAVGPLEACIDERGELVYRQMWLAPQVRAHRFSASIAEANAWFTESLVTGLRDRMKDQVSKALSDERSHPHEIRAALSETKPPLRREPAATAFAKLLELGYKRDATGHYIDFAGKKDVAVAHELRPMMEDVLPKNYEDEAFMKMVRRLKPPKPKAR